MDMEQEAPLFRLFGYVVEHQGGCVLELCDALEQGADGLMLLDPRGEASFMNRAAADIVRSGDGLSISSGLIVAKRPPESRKLTRNIRDVLTGREPSPAGGPRSLLVTRPSGKRPYVVCVMPPRRSHPRTDAQHCACVVRVRDLAHQREPTESMLSQTFGLTRREADLAIQLVRMPRLEAAAGRSGMAVNTARNHLRGIFLKTGTSSQGEAVQLLSKIP